MSAEEAPQLAALYYARQADVAKLYDYPFGAVEPVVTYRALP